MLGFDEERTLSTITVPVLTVGGANDRVTKSEASEHIAATVPKADLVLLDPGGHLGHWESHDQFLTALDRFMVEVTDSASSNGGSSVRLDSAVDAVRPNAGGTRVNEAASSPVK